MFILEVFKITENYTPINPKQNLFSKCKLRHQEKISQASKKKIGEKFLFAEQFYATTIKSLMRY